MKTTSFALALAVAAALTAPVSRDVQAGYSGINKCRAADGGVVYTDEACEAFGARQEPMSTDLGMRLASEQSRVSTEVGDAALADAMLPSAQGTPTGRRSLASGCARSPTQLAMDVQASLGLRDVNRLAESYYWVGMSHDASIPVMKQLEALSRTQLLGAQVQSMSMGLQFADASGEMMEPQAGSLLLSLHAEEGPRTVQLNVRQYAGCYFASF
jgi:hypothetical protein